MIPNLGMLPCLVLRHSKLILYRRPNADTVLKHPFFWSPAKRLAFLQDASDRFEVERRDPPSAILQRLEGNTHQVIGYDWSRRLDRVVNNDLRKFRKYDGRRVRDLLRVLRNKVSCNHLLSIPLFLLMTH